MEHAMVRPPRHYPRAPEHGEAIGAHAGAPTNKGPARGSRAKPGATAKDKSAAREKSSERKSAADERARFGAPTARRVASQDRDKRNSDEHPAKRAWGIRYHRRHPLAPFIRRSVNLGLRYRVLERDNFRCTTCGASPAADPKCRLHVDHIVPVAKGDETLLLNLRTLCSNCNWGKGARASGPGG
jgi:5-methylcytosine-specific restriction endonuclease McrA